MLPFSERTDLSSTEKAILAGYQDIGNPQHIWDHDIPTNERHHDCYIVNKSLRFSDFRGSLSYHDLKQVSFITKQIDAAIERSTVPKAYALFKGLEDASWILQRQVGETYEDRAYGSYSLILTKAKEYTKDYSGLRVFIYRIISKGEHALYMGSKEEELLLPRNKKHEILQINDYEPGEFLDDLKARVYYVREI